MSHLLQAHFLLCFPVCADSDPQPPSTSAHSGHYSSCPRLTHRSPFVLLTLCRTLQRLCEHCFDAQLVCGIVLHG
ncbi:hypothetical protein KC19_5G008200 [Ceratodon purpureus]|uniref:Secreted protein n=1 Tax=Ceratodon purpureus TaxID=3225 RepID=A0A8T0HWK6_CERPU|nr:hypothetical protein KC19_5G008200 [Ceratodon purpureus]